MDKYKNILVPCTSSKSVAKGDKSDLTSLSFNNELYHIRKYLVDKYLDSDCIFWDSKNHQNRHLNKCRNLDWVNCLPAYKRYTGVIFSQIEEQNWQKADEVLIISPLWGIIKPQDKIPNYTLMMTDQIQFQKMNRAIWKLWRPALDEILRELNPTQSTFSLLFNGCSLGFGVNTRNSFESLLTRWNDNYGRHKGIWLNQYLSSK